MPSNQTTKSDASRIQSTQVSTCYMSSGGFAARAQAAADRNANVASSKTGSSYGPSSGAQQSGQQSTPGKR
ncbi:hypothetical protein An18g00580 [Aspergillus niger]|uniref:SMP domain-containing protein n=2 Tax=Aspergillus niger TaxID=5061 RepID=A2R9X8_ASPNC|nr:hypothetical protein An18g00580 [Aspergillus niger]CAK43134.1 hypothetical protein An18g00580 [Aspergillus niger]